MLANQQRQPIVTFKTYPTKRDLGVSMLISYDPLISFTENQVVMNPTLIHTGDIVFPIKVNMNTILYHTGDTEYKQEEVELHTCYIDMGSGTFASKEMVSKFINKYNNTNEYADVHFILNMNQIPYQLEGHGSFTKEPSTKEIEHLVTRKEKKVAFINYECIRCVESRLKDTLQRFKKEHTLFRQYNGSASCKGLMWT